MGRGRVLGFESMVSVKNRKKVGKVLFFLMLMNFFNQIILINKDLIKSKVLKLSANFIIKIQENLNKKKMIII